MSVFVPPLSLEPFTQFLDTDPKKSGYDTFSAHAPNTALEKSIEGVIDTELTQLTILANGAKKHPALVAGLGLRDTGNYLGFRMATRLAEYLEIGALSKPPLKIELKDGGWRKLVWDDDITAQPTSLNSNSNQFEAEIRRQATDGDLFIIRHFLEAYGNGAIGKKPFTQDSLVWQLLSVWNALQIPLAQAIFSAKSRHKGVQRPYEYDFKKYPIFPTDLTRPLHTSYPSGHAAGAGALAGLIYWLLVVAGKANSAGSYVPIAYRVGLLREYAGLHWTQDTAKGFLAGLRFAHGVLDLALKNTRLEDLAWLLGQCVSKIK